MRFKIARRGESLEVESASAVADLTHGEQMAQVRFGWADVFAAMKIGEKTLLVNALDERTEVERIA